MASMMITRMCRGPTFQTLGSLQKLHYARNVPKNQTMVRLYASEGKDAAARAAARRATLKERVMQPTTGKPFAIGAGALAGASVLGVGALCYYGLGLSSGASIIDNATVWPQYVRDRVKATYMYFGGSVFITAASAMAAFRSPTIMKLVTRGGFMGILISMGAMVGTGILCQSIPYTSGLGVKQLAWVLHTATMGAVLAPLCFMGGPLLIRAAWYTAGVVGGLSAIAVCAPSEKFLYMGGPLAMGLGVVFVSSIGSMFFSPMSALGAGLYSISLYGGLILFSGFLLYDTQRIVAQAERYTTAPDMYGARPYDPINSCLSIYMDTLNIFIRIAVLLAGGGGQKRK
ncbi:growth hormone-inducible transmembrane protein-like [Coccinella septempunctata]|uniref:growth hormone-inducible transmembrane protein-like n=1 Tax=Coccinella septempunctata TaxID=41139 RepID=UPI001D082033|nr:growth hormone-inducible transmembrane protein-like [Coccinella septempunctata]